MLTVEAQRAGALARSRRTRAAYLLNPNRCLNDNVPIVWSSRARNLAEIKQRKFCDKSCAASYNNRAGKAAGTRRFGTYNVKNPTCAMCRQPIPRGVTNRATRTYCLDCAPKFVAKMQAQTIGMVSRRFVATHARIVTAGRPRECVRCGFKYGVQACHIKDVADFPASAKLAEVNAPENLVLLCPNDHWMFDREGLTIEEIAADAAARGMGLVQGEAVESPRNASERA
jgi:hypothetical protein